MEFEACVIYCDIYQQQLHWATWDPRKCLVMAPHLRENLREPSQGVCYCIGPEDSGNLRHTEGPSVTTEITSAVNDINYLLFDLS